MSVSGPTRNRTAIDSSSGSAARLVRPHQPRWFQRVLARLVYALVHAVSATLRYRYNDRSGFFSAAPAGPAIYCVWHNRLALCLIVYSNYVRPRSAAEGLAAMVSASRDGGFLAGILKCFGVEPVRGSSSRRGPQALLELTTWAERGFDLALTPDGPRGPRYVVQEGIMSLAQLTGLPIIPVSYHLSSKLELKSWDGFQVPLPFSRCEVFLEKPLRVPRECDEPARKLLREQLEHTLHSISED